MLKYLFAILIIYCSFSFTVSAQQLPAEGDTVNYRLAGFFDNTIPTATRYLLEVANGYQLTARDFEKHTIIRQTDTSNKIIAIVPSFGSDYTWRISTLNNKQKKQLTGTLHHFTTGKLVFVDTSRYRLRVIDNATHHKDLLVFFSDSKVLYNLKGEALWFLPPITGVEEEFTNVRDIKPTPDGTITFLSGKVCEVNYRGKVLWQKAMKKKPGEDELMFYHHEFTKMSNGHYMAAIHDVGSIKVKSEDIDTTGRKKPMAQFYKTINGQTYRQFPTGGLQEFDSSGSIVWHWTPPQKLLDDSTFITNKPSSIEDMTPHMNSFYVDEIHNNIYIGYRNNSSILKIKYPSGDIIALYRGDAKTPYDFHAQHNVSLTEKGEIQLFDNNFLLGHDTNVNEKTSHIVLLKETPGFSQLEKVWDFPCDIDTTAPSSTGTGGSAYQLTDGCFIATMGIAGRTFIVSPDKKIIWNAITEEKTEAWHNQAQYRVSVITDYKSLKRIIFHIP